MKNESYATAHDISDAKRRLREEVRQLKALRESRENNEEAEALGTLLLHHPHWLSARHILLFHPLPDEIDIFSAVKDTDKQLLLPQVTGETTMVLHSYEGEDSLKKGAFGIMEPTGNTFYDYHEIDLAIIPGVAFDSEGHRLGRGKGYYDRFLPLLSPHCHKMGVCFSYQLFPSIPHDSHDIMMDEVLSVNVKTGR